MSKVSTNVRITLSGDIDLQEGTLSLAGQEKIDELIGVDAYTAAEILSDWVDQLKFHFARAVAADRGEIWRTTVDAGGPRPTIDDLEAIYTELGHSVHEVGIGDAFDTALGLDTDMASELHEKHLAMARASGKVVQLPIKGA